MNPQRCGGEVLSSRVFLQCSNVGGSRSEVTLWDVGRSIRTLPPIADGWRANRKQSLRVLRLPPKRPCIDWSGQLPDGRQLLPNRVMSELPLTRSESPDIS